MRIIDELWNKKANNVALNLQLGHRNRTVISNVAKIDRSYYDVAVTIDRESPWDAHPTFSCTSVQTGGGNGRYVPWRPDRTSIVPFDDGHKIVVSSHFHGCAFFLFRDINNAVYGAHIHRGGPNTQEIRDGVTNYLNVTGGFKLYELSTAHLDQLGSNDGWFVAEQLGDTICICFFCVDGNGQIHDFISNDHVDLE